MSNRGYTVVGSSDGIGAGVRRGTPGAREDRSRTLPGKYGGTVKATSGARARLPLPSRERVGVRVHRGAALPLTLTLSPTGPTGGEGNGTEHALGDCVTRWDLP